MESKRITSRKFLQAFPGLRDVKNGRKASTTSKIQTFPVNPDLKLPDIFNDQCGGLQKWVIMTVCLIADSGLALTLVASGAPQFPIDHHGLVMRMVDWLGGGPHPGCHMCG